MKQKPVSEDMSPPASESDNHVILFMAAANHLNTSAVCIEESANCYSLKSYGLEVKADQEDRFQFDQIESLPLIKLYEYKLECKGKGSPLIVLLYPVQMVPEEAEDLWHAYNLILVGDRVTATTVR